MSGDCVRRPWPDRKFKLNCLKVLTDTSQDDTLRTLLTWEWMMLRMIEKVTPGARLRMFETKFLALEDFGGRPLGLPVDLL